MPGDRWQQFANLRALLRATCGRIPGKQLLFMGGELAQEREWSHDALARLAPARRPEHAGVQRLVRDLNRGLPSEPALWDADFEPRGLPLARRRRRRPQRLRLRAALDATARAPVACVVQPLAGAAARATASACRTPAVGARRSTPTRGTTAAPTSATSAASWPSRARGRVSRARRARAPAASASSGWCPTRERSPPRTSESPAAPGRRAGRGRPGRVPRLGAERADA